MIDDETEYHQIEVPQVLRISFLLLLSLLLLHLPDKASQPGAHYFAQLCVLKKVDWKLIFDEDKRRQYRLQRPSATLT